MEAPGTSSAAQAPAPVPLGGEEEQDLAQELDLTNSHLASLADVPLAPSLTALDLTANRLRQLEPQLLALAGLRRLSLRQNVLTDVSALAQSASASGLEELVLHDNQLTEVPDLGAFSALQRLDLSFNQLRALAPLAALPGSRLRDLYAASNKLTAIEALGHLTALTQLELGCNRLRAVEGFDTLARLEELWLGKNRISQVANLGGLTRLRRLSLQSNRLTSMAGIEECTSLEELYLSHNAITRIEGLEGLTRLKVLDVSSNLVAELEGVDSLAALEDLWLNDNRIADWGAAQAALAACPARATLACLYLHGNPAVAGLAQGAYRAALLDLLPGLQQLDSDYVRGGP